MFVAGLTTVLPGLAGKGTVMQLFHPGNRTRSDAHERIYAVHELIYTINDVGAAAMFVVGSILFFDEATVYAGTWLFLVGSVMFGVRPMIKLVREIRYLRMDAQGSPDPE